MKVVAVVLAGGASRRFGSDKLEADLAGRTLLDRAVTSLPDEWPLIVIGPSRTLTRPATFVVEDPPGSGPAAALVTGAKAAQVAGADVLTTLPGDAPDGGLGAFALVEALLADDTRLACVATDETGRDQPLQVAVRGEALHALARFTGSANLRARDLLPALPGLHRIHLPQASLTDVDTPEQAAAWLVRHG